MSWDFAQVPVGIQSHTLRIWSRPHQISSPTQQCALCPSVLYLPSEDKQKIPKAVRNRDYEKHLVLSSLYF